MPKPVLFWDSAALIRAVMGEAHDPYRQLLEWGEAGLLDMRLSRDVIREVECILLNFGDELVVTFALILDRARFAVTPDPDTDTVDWCEELTGYRADGRIVAAAHECNAEYLLTYDRRHLLENPLLGPPDMRCRVRTPEACLEAIRVMLRDTH